MQTKSTDSTRNRPEGERIIDAPFVFADLEKYTHQLKEEEAWKKNDRNGITLYKTDGVTIVLTCLHKNAAIEDNSVEGLLTVQVLDGVIEFSSEQNSTELKKNQLVALHPGLLHTIKAKKEAALLLINRSGEDEI